MLFSNLKSYMDRLVEEYHVPGLDCIVYKNHEMLFRYYTGMRDLESRKPMTGSELFIIFSMTKMLTCTCALQLLEKGKYAMNDPVSRYLPEFEKMKVSNTDFDDLTGEKVLSGAITEETVQSDSVHYANNPITIKDLFTMGAGLDYNRKAPGIVRALKEGKTSTRELVSALSETVLGFEPGTRFHYSLCHDVLGALIEVWSGKRFGAYMKENVLDPLGMKNTFFWNPQKNRQFDKMAARYTYNENRMPERLPLECVFLLSDQYESGGAGLVSTAEDYAVFLDALANHGTAKNGYQLLAPATVALMGTNHLTGKQLEDFDKLIPGYGYGLGVRTHMDKTRSGSLSPVGEFGWDGAAGGFSMVDPKNGISLTYFQQIHRWDRRIQTEMRNALYADLGRQGLLDNQEVSN